MFNDVNSLSSNENSIGGMDGEGVYCVCTGSRGGCSVGIGVGDAGSGICSTSG